MLVKKFRGRVVKRMRQVRDGILLIYLSKVPGEPGKQEVISQADWDQHGEEKQVGTTLSTLRQAAAGV